MKNALRSLGVGLAAAFAAAQPAPALATDEPPPDPYEAALERALGVEKQLVDALAKVRPASVSVVIKKRFPDARGVPTGEPRMVGCGSGVIVTFSSKTWIITNDHVAGGADALDVITSDGKVWPVEMVDSVKHYDIALLRFKTKTTGIKGVSVNSRPSKDLNEGQWVLATGNPFFLAMDGQSVCTLGVISGKDRVLGQDQVYGNAIQHDAAVNPGNSGGPLWNLKGELVGINGMIASRGAGGLGWANTGASFSIPIFTIEPYLAKLADAKQDAQAGFLGLDCDTAKDPKGNPVGARVVRVHPRSPARGPSSDGLLPDDVIVSVTCAGKVTTIQTSGDLVNLLTVCPAGTRVTLKYRRGRTTESWTGKLGDEK